jgi:hypothetical protein
MNNLLYHDISVFLNLRSSEAYVLDALGFELVRCNLGDQF